MRTAQILPDLELHKTTLYIPSHKTAIIADLHIGIEQSMIDGGTFIPKNQLRMFKQELRRVFAQLKPETLIINGDLKHEFSRVNRQEWNDIAELIEYIKGHARIRFIKGNHDNLLKPILDKKSIRLEQKIRLGDFLIVHGDKLIDDKDCKTIIMGHEHPAFVLDDLIRQERFKCLLLGKYKQKNLVIMPSFNPLITGTEVETEGSLSPYIKRQKFKKYVIGREIYLFKP